MRFTAVALLVLTAFGSTACAAKNEQTFVLEEQLGHAWASDVIYRPLDPMPIKEGKAAAIALTIDGKPAPAQAQVTNLAERGGISVTGVWFRTDLPANAKRTVNVRVVETAPAVPAGADAPMVTKRGNTVELSNGLTAVRLPLGAWSVPKDATTPELVAAALSKHLGVPATEGVADASGAPGPILGVRLVSGKWTPASRLTAQENLAFDPPGLVQNVGPTGPAGKLIGYDSSITEGPIVTSACMNYHFEGGGIYTAEIELRAGEPAVRVDETYKKAGAIVFGFGPGFQPTKAIYNSFRAEPKGKVLPIAYDKPTNFGYFVGWNFFFQKQAPAILLTGDSANASVGLVSTDPDWLPFPYNQGLHLWTTAAAGGTPGQVLAKASLAEGHRHWAIVTPPASQFPEGDKQCADFYRWWVQRFMLPLGKVSSWQLTWDGMDDIAFPHTYFSAGDLPNIRKTLQAQPSVQKLLTGEGDEALRDTKQNDVTKKRMTDIAARYLVTGDAALLPQLKQCGEGLSYLDHFVKMYLDEAGPLTDDQVGGMAVSDEMLKRCIGLEFLLGSDQLTKQEKREMLKKLAFMVYVLHDPFWMAPNYPFLPHTHEPYPAYVQGTPNQKHCYISARGMTESMLTGHPMHAAWTKHTLEEYDRALAGSVAESGVHAESPFYSSRDTMRFGPFWRALTRAGVKGPIVDKWMGRIKNTFEYMTDMTTPPEPRMGGARVYHPLGRSSSGVVDPTFVIAVDAWAKGDDEYASRMRWIWEQQGKPSLYIMDTTGGRNIGLTLLASVDMFNAKPLVAPPLADRRWEGFGAIFRSNVGSGFESNVLFRHDPFCWDLYEGNNGAVYFYGKGSPLLARFGAYWTQPNLMSIPFGNRVQFASGDTKEEWVNAIGSMTNYVSLGDQANFASGITEVKDWRRSVLFAKDLDRDDAAYLLVRDDIARPNSATALHWWVMSKAVQPEGPSKPGVVAYRGNDEGWVANLGKNWSGAPQLKGQLQRFEGLFGVNLDMFIASPSDPKIITDAVGVGPSLAYNVTRSMYETQQLVRIEQPAQKPYVTLLVPRWAGGVEAKYRTIADGAGVAVEHAGGQDRLFLGEGAVKFKDDAADIDAHAGYLRSGPGDTVRLMVNQGRITARGITLTSAKTAALIVRSSGVQVMTDDPKDVKVELPVNLKALKVTVTPAKTR